MTRRLLAVTYKEALTLHSMARNRRRRDERQRAKSTFVPEPGRRHAGDIAIENSRRLENRLMDFVEGFPEYDPDEWIDDDSGESEAVPHEREREERQPQRDEATG